MPPVTYERHDGPDAAAAALGHFLPAYEEVYADPPYSEGPGDVAQFTEHYAHHVQRHGMRLVLARDGEDVVGFSYGYYLPADTGWWSNVDRHLDEDFTRETGVRTWVVLELAVRRPWRRQGIARGLHDALLDGLAAERVTLTVRPEPEAAPAQAAYAAWGYQPVGTSHPWEDAPYYTALVLDRTADRT
ncbi:GNAT family N-acetyltransferase [Streptomyces sp. TRM 70351]|uniref:GNAT family N-acetyltransferase n=1 Tax=Streptomyces sp. TRM 70351 TaxID=3116552 RepID=UPI002E7B4C4C|nr:GNAT family N-acetyltransferase [Streptomyces sp. TRM 70351]MEE1927943.1 GNAT family N-acetyltransferase [Streptomyces sp. TRM 70351]